jgi:hypothetical protein
MRRCFATRRRQAALQAVIATNPERKTLFFPKTTPQRGIFQNIN